MKIRLLIIAALILVLSIGPLQAVVATNNVEIDGRSQNGEILLNFATVQLKDQPLASYDGHIAGYAATKPAHGLKLDISTPAAQAYSNYLAGKRAELKTWLSNNAPEVTVVSEFSVTLNAISVQLNGHSLSHLNGGWGVARAINNFVIHTDMNRSPTLIGAQTLWNTVGGQSNAGAGEKIGIIDTGIDTTHPFLTDNSLTVPAGYPKCDALDSAVGRVDTACKYVSNKVLVAKIFCTQPVCVAFDAQAKQSHGSHVAGIAAGVANTCAPFVGCTLSGIAPKAWLGNYNVFPGNVTSSSSDDIALAVDAAVADGMDVLNLSLGGPPVDHDPLVDAVNAATDAGLVVAVAAGNSGPFSGSIESPGIAEKVITAGASTNPHFLGVPVTADGLGTAGGAYGDFNHFGQVNGATYVLTTPANGCTAISQNLTAKIALIRRGTCTFTTKIRNAQTAGAIGVIVIQSVAGDPVAMGHDGSKPFPTIPALMVSRAYGNSMTTATTQTVTIDGTNVQEFFSDGPGADILAGFSSRGPPILLNPVTGAFERVLPEMKPDVLAPGVNVYSSVLSSSCTAPPCFAFFQGTSMATPHVAGSAAVLKQQHPNWDPVQIKSALVNTAKRPIGGGFSYPMYQGGGRIDLAAASKITATVEVSSHAAVDFGQVPRQFVTRGIDVQLDRIVPGTSTTYSIAVIFANPGVSVTVSSPTVTVNMDNAQFRVTLKVTSTTVEDEYYGDIVLTGGTVPIVIPFYTEIVAPTVLPRNFQQQEI
ncbi:MAG TPA: S8 family serine peptidase [Candidatus Bathyarchaeia archaeon]|nr:S8 family serine peptidase [Candidatus Bathyarchaeia archaeon]